MVSVFSDESRVVQLQNCSYVNIHPDVSVFSDESRVVQPTPAAAAPYQNRRFSILWRISCGATIYFYSHFTKSKKFQYSLTNLVWCNATRRGGSVPPVKFQYSLTNLVWCNTSPLKLPGHIWLVSVFSDESRVVQLTTKRRLPVGSVVSVFSDESRVVQQLNPVAASILSTCFSILWRISCGATIKALTWWVKI